MSAEGSKTNEPTECGFCHRLVRRGFEPDPCLGELPGVDFACCGHGERPGYLSFHDGTRIEIEAKHVQRCKMISTQYGLCCTGVAADQPEFWNGPFGVDFLGRRIIVQVDQEEEQK